MCRIREILRKRNPCDKLLPTDMLNYYLNAQVVACKGAGVLKFANLSNMIQAMLHVICRNGTHQMNE